MMKDKTEMDDELRPEYDLKRLKLRKTGPERKELHMILPENIKLPKPQYLTDASGKTSHVILTVDEYDKLIHLLKDIGASTIDSSEEQTTPPDGPITLKGKKAIDFYGILKSDYPDYVKQIVEDKEIYYDI